MEVVQHRLGISEAEMVGRKQQLTQRLQEERQASQGILAYLDRHYNVRGEEGKNCLSHFPVLSLVPSVSSLSLYLFLSLLPCSLSPPGPRLPAGSLDDQT